MDELKGVKIGVIAQCEGGSLIISSYQAASALDNDGKVVQEFKGGGNHFKNFIEAVQNRTPNTLAAPILQGHYIQRAVPHREHFAAPRPKRCRRT